MIYENSPQPWASTEFFSRGGNVDILLILFTLLKMQFKWTVTKRFTLATRSFLRCFEGPTRSLKFLSQKCSRTGV